MNDKQAVDFLHQLMQLTIAQNAADLFISAGAKPSLKKDGKLISLTSQPLSPGHARQLVRSVMNDKQIAEFDQTSECNFAVSLPGKARFRVNAFIQRGSPGMVMRVINSHIPDFKTLHLPDILKNIAMEQRGLIIFVGGTGSGKSTSLASMINYRNQHSQGHIVTIEDPIEYIHMNHNCIVTQREIGVDTDSYEIALKNTLRQSPDVILIGEIRDAETMGYAIAFAETGHLCLSTLHANNTNQALDRIINFFDISKKEQLLMDLSLNLKGIVSQRLITKRDHSGRVPAVEVMLNTPLMSNLILKGNIHEIKALIKKSQQHGMQTFDQSLFDLYEKDFINYDDALRHADSENDLRLKIKLDSKKNAPVEDLPDSLSI